MFFEKTDLCISDSDRRQVDALSQLPVVQYPVYFWVKNYLTDGTIITKPENQPTNDFDTFLKALESLKCSSSMRTLALPVSEQVSATLTLQLKTLNQQYSSVNLSLLRKKIDILKSDLTNKKELATDIDNVLTLAKGHLNTGKTAIEDKLSRIQLVMSTPNHQNSSETTSAHNSCR